MVIDNCFSGNVSSPKYLVISSLKSPILYFEVSIIISALSLTSLNFFLSNAIPVITLPPPDNGWPLLFSLNLFTRTSSVASKNNISYLNCSFSKSLKLWNRSLKNTPPLISITNATLSIFPSLCLHASANFVINVGGRLSTQKYPISSKLLVASDLPAPDNPVTIINLM